MMIISVAYVIVAIVGTVNGVYGLADSSVSGICVMDNTYLRFASFMDNVKAPLDRVSVDFNAAVDQMKDAVVFNASLAQNSKWTLDNNYVFRVFHPKISSSLNQPLLTNI